MSLSVPTSFTTFFTQVYCLVTPFIAILNILLPHYTLDWFSTTGFTALHRSFYCLIVYVLIAALLIKTFSMLCYSYTSKEVKRLESNLFTCFNISTLHHLLTKTFTASINLSFFSTPFNPFYIFNAFFFISYCFSALFTAFRNHLLLSFTFPQITASLFLVISLPFYFICYVLTAFINIYYFSTPITPFLHPYFSTSLLLFCTFWCFSTPLLLFYTLTAFLNLSLTTLLYLNCFSTPFYFLCTPLTAFLHLHCLLYKSWALLYLLPFLYTFHWFSTSLLLSTPFKASLNLLMLFCILNRFFN